MGSSNMRTVLGPGKSELRRRSEEAAEWFHTQKDACTQNKLATKGMLMQIRSRCASLRKASSTGLLCQLESLMFMG